MKIRVLRLCVPGAVLALLAWWLPRQLAGAAGLAPGVSVDPGSLHPGDVILRRGRDTVSGMVLAVDSGSRYSHVGIIVAVGGLRGVVHALPEDPAHPEGYVLLEPVGEFLSPERASELAIYRLREPAGDTAGQAARHARRSRT